MSTTPQQQQQQQQPQQNQQQQQQETSFFDWSTHLQDQPGLDQFLTQIQSIDSQTINSNPLKNHSLSIPEPIFINETPLLLHGDDPDSTYLGYSMPPFTGGPEDFDVEYLNDNNNNNLNDIDMQNNNSNNNDELIIEDEITKQTIKTRLSDAEWSQMLREFLQTPLSPPSLTNPHTNLQSSTIPTPSSSSSTTTTTTTTKISLHPFFDNEHNNDAIDMESIPHNDAGRFNNSIIRALIQDTKTYFQELKNLQFEKETDPINEENDVFRELNDIITKHTKSKLEYNDHLQTFDDIVTIQKPIDEDDIDTQIINKDKQSISSSSSTTTPSSSSTTTTNNNNNNQTTINLQDPEFVFNDEQLLYLKQLQDMVRINFHKMFHTAALEDIHFNISKPLSHYLIYDQYDGIAEKVRLIISSLKDGKRQSLIWVFDMTHKLITFPTLITPLEQAIISEEETGPGRYADYDEKDPQAFLYNAAKNALRAIQKHKNDYDEKHYPRSELDAIDISDEDNDDINNVEAEDEEEKNMSDAEEWVDDDDDDIQDITPITTTMGDNDDELITPQSLKIKSPTIQNEPKRIQQESLLPPVEDLSRLTEDEIDIKRQEYVDLHLNKYSPTYAELLSGFKTELELITFLEMYEENYFTPEWYLQDWVKLKYGLKIESNNDNDDITTSDTLTTNQNSTDDVKPSSSSSSSSTTTTVNSNFIDSPTFDPLPNQTPQLSPLDELILSSSTTTNTQQSIESIPLPSQISPEFTASLPSFQFVIPESDFTLNSTSTIPSITIPTQTDPNIPIDFSALYDLAQQQHQAKQAQIQQQTFHHFPQQSILSAQQLSMELGDEIEPLYQIIAQLAPLDTTPPTPTKPNQSTTSTKSNSIPSSSSTTTTTHNNNTASSSTTSQTTSTINNDKNIYDPHKPSIFDEIIPESEAMEISLPIEVNEEFLADYHCALLSMGKSH